jgi:hypothetical protein
MVDHLGSRSVLNVGEHAYTIFRLDAVDRHISQAARKTASS